MLNVQRQPAAHLVAVHERINLDPARTRNAQPRLSDVAELLPSGPASDAPTGRKSVPDRLEVLRATPENSVRRHFPPQCRGSALNLQPSARLTSHVIDIGISRNPSPLPETTLAHGSRRVTCSWPAGRARSTPIGASG